MATSESIQGACNCGAIKISIEKSSVSPFSGLCHCLGCRASSGSLFSLNLPTPTSAITITGTPKTYDDKDTDSGHTAKRHFCGDCGSPIMTVVNETSDTAFVKGGLFAKGGVEIPPAMVEVFWRNAEKWEKKADGMQVCDANWVPEK